MSFIVKNTTKIHFLDLFCPFHCKKCGCLGSPLCECCKKDIIKLGAKKNRLKGFLDTNWLKEYKLPFQKSWACGWRDEVVGQLAQDYKYHATRTIGPILAEILAETIPDIGENVVVVPLPTIMKHVRERGFDHTLKVAQKLVKLRGWECQKILRRVNNTVQVGAAMVERRRQAEEAYEVISKKIDKKQKYLLLDDVWTTGASLCAAEKLLRNKGAKKIYAVVLAVSR